ncbi:MAG TPA: hypothetical protein VI320_21920 [Terracidiphilus sp.]|jgi:hypothetical protein
MGIVPITNLIPLPTSRAIPAGLEPLPMERIENSARTKDEAYSPSGGKSARGSADDDLEGDVYEGEVDESEDELDGGAIAETAVSLSGPWPAEPISLYV